MTTSLTGTLAEFVAEGAHAAASQERRAAAIASLIDTIGVVVAGSHSEIAEPLARWSTTAAPTAGERDWNGVPAGATPEHAAMIAGTIGHALDFDDALPGAGHPSNILYAALLAVDNPDLSGERLLDSFVIGYEVNARVARAVGHRHYLRGWHTTSTVGVFGATASCCAAAGFDEHTTRMALGIAASLASGLQRNFGSHTKALHAGLAARHGVLAAGLAARGMTAADDIFDGERSFLDIYADGASRPEACEGLGDRWAITDPGATVKLYPAALEVYRAVEGAVAATARLGVRLDEIASVECGLPPGTTGPLLYDWPTTGIQAKFSLPYTVAAALIGETLTLADFTDAAIRRPDIQHLMQRVRAVEDTRYRPDDIDGRNASASFGGFVEVTVTDVAGRSATDRIDDVVGSPDRPLTREQRLGKFTMCLAEAGHSPAVATEIYAQLEDISSATDVATVLTTTLNATPAKEQS